MNHVIYVLADRSLADVIASSGAVLLEKVQSYCTILSERPDWDRPRGWAFHDWASAVDAFEHPLPAWTNMDTRLVHIDPQADDWRRIYAGVVQLVDDSDAAPYADLHIDDIAAIAGHELTHHLRAFRETPDGAQWFEEGFCFAVPRRWILSRSRYLAVRAAESTLVRAYADQFGATDVWDFGANDDGSGWPAALYDYWRAIGVVESLITHQYGDDPWTALSDFERWCRESQGTPLAAWVGLL